MIDSEPLWINFCLSESIQNCPSNVIDIATLFLASLDRWNLIQLFLCLDIAFNLRLDGIDQDRTHKFISISIDRPFLTITFELFWGKDRWIHVGKHFGFICSIGCVGFIWISTDLWFMLWVQFSKFKLDRLLDIFVGWC